MATTYENYILNNKSKAYKVAENSITYDVNNRPTISKDDEWVSETEWDDLFLQLTKERNNK